jgi:hypothetical protein
MLNLLALQMMDYLIPLVYAAAGVFIFLKWKRMQSEQLSGIFLAGVFGVKVVLSAVYIFLHYRYYGGADTANYYDDSKIIYGTLGENPLKYLLLTFGPNNLSVVPTLIAGEVEAMGYWTDSSSYSVVRFYALSNLLSGGNIYAAGVFMAFITTIGLNVLFRVTGTVYKNDLLNKIIVFGIPSVLFWTSGAHKEGLIITGLSIFIYSLIAITEKKRTGIIYFCKLLLSGWLLWYVRDFTFYLLLPGCVAYLLSTYFNLKKTVWIFAAVYFVFLGAGLLIQFNMKNERLNMLESVEQKQQQFQHSQRGNTDITIAPVKPTLAEMAAQVPIAFMRTLMIGFWVKPTKAFHWIFLIENIFLLLLLCYLFYIIFKSGFVIHPTALWLLLFAITMMVLIGLVVANAGAIIRYRSVLLPFMMLGIEKTIKK